MNSTLPSVRKARPFTFDTGEIESGDVEKAFQLR